MFSCVLIIPTNLKDKANELGASFGWGPENFSVQLGETHYGCHAWVSQNFLDLLEQPQEGYEDVMEALIVSVRSDHMNHFDEVLAENNLIINNG